MPIDTYITGNDGNFSYTGNSSAQTLFKVRSYAANINRVVTDQTGFGDTGKRKRVTAPGYVFAGRELQAAFVKHVKHKVGLAPIEGGDELQAPVPEAFGGGGFGSKPEDEDVEDSDGSKRLRLAGKPVTLREIWAGAA